MSVERPSHLPRARRMTVPGRALRPPSRRRRHRQSQSIQAKEPEKAAVDRRA